MSKVIVPRRTGAVLLIILVLASTIVYYNIALSSESARIEDLQRAVDEIENKNSQLERQLSLLERPQGNTSLFGLDTVRIYADSNRSVVTIAGSKITVVDTAFGPRRGIEDVIGSGFVIQYSSTDYIVTNFHVVDGLVNVTVTFWDGDTYRAEVVGSDVYVDLAVVSAEASAEEFYPLQLSSSSTINVGDPVVAIGNPFGLSGSVTFGIISQLGRTMQYESSTGSFPMADVIQFSAPINPGNSGGPLLTANGMVVGMTTAVVSGSQGLGFAIPSDTILREVPSLVNSGKYALHPYLGIQGIDMNYQLSQVIGVNVTYGVLVEKTASGGPASKAGLKGGDRIVEIGGEQYLVGGDIIVSINGTRIVNGDSLSTYLERYTLPGQVIQAGIIRAGSFMIVQVTLGARPPL
jgi:S1-C subfamily serine protease